MSRVAPVKEPRTWPKSSLSSRLSLSALQFWTTNGRSRARAVVMERAGDQLLAGAVLAGDQHRALAVDDLLEDGEEPLHGRRLADDVGELVAAAELAVELGDASLLLVDGARELDDLLDGGLEQVLEVVHVLRRERRHRRVGVGRRDDGEPFLLGVLGNQRAALGLGTVEQEAAGEDRAVELVLGDDRAGDHVEAHVALVDEDRFHLLLVREILDRLLDRAVAAARSPPCSRGRPRRNGCAGG